MKNKIAILFCSCLLAILVSSGTYKVASTGAPIGSTGAPGESTCAKAGCHTGAPVNTGNGRLKINAEDLSEGYLAGKIYEITVSLNQENIKRFGFSFSVLNTQLVNAGTLMVSDPARTQVLNGTNQFSGRDYMTYKAAGTSPYSEGLGQWTFRWKAPDRDEGPVTFFYAAVSANNDGTDEGDLVYTDSLVVPGMLSSSATPNGPGTFNLYPNPVKERFYLSYTKKAAGNTRIQLSDLKGKNSIVLWEGNQETGKKNLELLLPQDLANGTYLLGIQTDNAFFCKKLVANR